MRGQFQMLTIASIEGGIHSSLKFQWKIHLKEVHGACPIIQ